MNIDVPPITCAAVTTSRGVDSYVRLMGVVSDETGLITAAFLRGRNADNVFYDSEETPIDAVQAPMDGSDFELVVNRNIEMFTSRGAIERAGPLQLARLCLPELGFR